MTKLKNYTYENLEVGKWYDGYKEIHKVLGAKKYGGDKKELQFKEWQRNFKMKIYGNRILVEEIYESPIPLENPDEEIRYYLQTGVMSSKGRDQRMLNLDIWSEDDLKRPVHRMNPKLIEMWDIDKNGFEIPEFLDAKDYDIYWWNCFECGYNFELATRTLFQGVTVDSNIKCPCCSLSENARKIFDILTLHNINFKMEYFFPELIGTGGKPLRFDFAIIDSDGSVKLIEYDGEFHDSDIVVVDHDIRKDNYCQKNNISLLRIHHTQNEFIEDMTLDYLNIKSFEHMRQVVELGKKYRESVIAYVETRLDMLRNKNKTLFEYTKIKNK